MEYQSSHTSTRGFPVEFAVLGFLSEGPMHGYALRDRIAQGLGSLWQVASSQVYQVLHRLEASGRVERSMEPSSAGPSRTVYALTDQGIESFEAWSVGPVEHMRHVRVEFAAKLYFLRRRDPTAVSILIGRQLDVLRAIRNRITSADWQGSDDGILNSAWQEFQLSAIDGFSRWLSTHRVHLEALSKESP